jgi:pimeloyl-ACP methyl ester carboxylesterase
MQALLRPFPEVPSAEFAPIAQALNTGLFVNRRTFITSASALSLAPVCAWGGQSPLTSVDVQAGGEHAVARKARVLLPPERSARRRVLILLHGRGEASSPRLGLRAWPELYGLIETDARLRRGEVAPELAKGELAYTRKKRLAELNKQLRETPYRGMVFVCPVTPNPASQPNRSRFLDAYATWLSEQLMPAVKAQVPEARWFALDGCSMGGPIALETFLRRPALFAELGMIQSAFGAFRAPGYAEQLEQAFQRAGPKPLQLLTSTRDDYLDANRALARECEARGVAASLTVARGPHNQPFLRQIGTLLSIRWHDLHLPV